MKIAILGTGYVGLSTGVCLSEIGHNVCCIDVDEQKIQLLKQGKSPIYEPGLEYLLVKNVEAGRLNFTISHQEGIAGVEVVIIAVGTPKRGDGGADLTYLIQAAQDISPYLQNGTIVVIKSTVPVGTNDLMKRIIEGHCQKGLNFHMISNPEFLRQGTAIQDTMAADRIIIGFDNKEAALKIQEMYSPLKVPFHFTGIRSAELIKYASNAFLAMKISFINEIANLCEAVGADVKEVSKGIGADKRIGDSFLKPGIGYGGSCFPKDVKALYFTSGMYGKDFAILREIMAINEEQQELLVRKALTRFKELKGKKITMLGLAFKPETDDMREAPSIKIARLLTSLGALVVAYDPVAETNAKKILGDTIKYASTLQEAAVDADALLIVTEWNEFKQMDIPTTAKLMNQPIIFDGRNCLEDEKIKACHTIEYYPIGRPPIIVGMEEAI